MSAPSGVSTCSYPLRAQRLGHALAVVDIHLTAVGLDVELLRPGHGAPRVVAGNPLKGVSIRAMYSRHGTGSMCASRQAAIANRSGQGQSESIRAENRRCSTTASAAFRADRTDIGKGPFAVVICEDRTEIGSTIDHVLGLGFRAVFHGRPRRISATRLWPNAATHRSTGSGNPHAAPDIAQDVVNALIDKAPGQWLHYCYIRRIPVLPVLRGPHRWRDDHMGHGRTPPCRPDLRDRSLRRGPQPLSPTRCP